MLVEPNDIVRVTSSQLYDGAAVFQNVYHLRMDGIGYNLLPAIEDDLGAWLESIHSELVALTTSFAVFTEWSAFNETQNNPLGTFSWPTLTDGGAGGDPLPGGLAALLVLRTGINRVIGRKYYGPFTEESNAGSVLSAALQTAVLAASAPLLGSFAGVSTGELWLPGIKSKAGPFWGFQEAIVRVDWAYQRRRKPGVGI